MFGCCCWNPIAIVCRFLLNHVKKKSNWDTPAECHPPFSRIQREMTLKRVNILRLNFEYELKLYWVGSEKEIRSAQESLPGGGFSLNRAVCGADQYKNRIKKKYIKREKTHISASEGKDKFLYNWPGKVTKIYYFGTETTL